MSDKNFDPGMEDTCELKEAWADGKKLYYVEDIPGLLEQIASLNKQLAKANERVRELESELDLRDVKIIDLQHQVGTLEFNQVTPKDLNKFAIEKKVEAINEALDYYEELKASEEPIGAGSILHVCLGRLISQQKQLRKEQENG
ncbi:MAG: hypothetical protein CMO73_12600 [Verrucomicrobiales bacterium]|nr:hypothetical protein [Verrucomicrobiales bacterium]|tara:strand:+ start:44 stop:475 length:432 start_codon:yes stop_codon:yes gene_type:complete